MSDIEMVHLHVHSAKGSHQDAMTDVDALFKKAKEFGMNALALTDHGTCASWHTARKASIKYGIKFLPGQEFYFVSDVNDQKEKRKHIVLIAKNEAGYKNLLRLNYEGYINKQYVAVMQKVFPRIDWALLEKYHEGIICLTACGSGLVSRQMFLHNEDGIWLGDACHTSVIDTVKKLKNIFEDDLYLELQPHNLKIFQKNRKTGETVIGKDGNPVVIVDQNHINNMLLKVGRQLGVNLVCTTDIHYLNKHSAKAHDVLMAISSKTALSNPDRHRYEVEEFYMKTGKEVYGHFATHFNSNLAVELIQNTVNIANKCEDPKYLDSSGVRFPVFIVKDQADYNDFEKWYKKQPYYQTIRDDNAYLRYKCITNFTKMFPHLKGEKRKVYVERIKSELEVLEMHNFCSYMLVVADLIEWAGKQHPMAVGRYGRGSAAGVLVGYLIGIHAVDPIEYGLLFERFHNKDKKSFPDIDTDFHPDYRNKVEQYIVEKYGKEKVAHVSNLSRMTPKVVIKDIARSLELGGGKSEAFKIANKITDTISPDAKTIDEALLSSKEFRDACRKYPELEEYSKELIGLEKTYATHAAGVVISDIDLSTYVPLRVDKNNVVSVQYEKNQCEEVGLIKMDLLGLEHLKTISDTIDNARAIGFDCPDRVPNFTDEKVWAEMSKGRTLCMFQLESELMQGLCRSIKPKNIEDLAVINALNRPSAAQKPYESRGDKRDWRKIYADRRDNKEKVVHKYKPVEQSFGNTYGICVFEEQLMSIAKYACGWDLNKADQLRKLTKLKEKGKDLAAKLQKEFIEDTVAFSGLTLEQAEDIWTNTVEPFAKYGFNKSHAVAYSMNGYETGWYKLYYPAPFMAAMLKSEANSNGQDRELQIRTYKKETERLGISILAPSINKSTEDFYALDSKTIMTGLNAIKGIGEKAVINIIEARNKHPFKSFHDFLLRTDSRYVRKDVIEALAKAGCLDEFGLTRKDMIELYADVRKKVNDYVKKNNQEGKESWNILNGFEYLKYTNEDYNSKQRLEGEKETLGEYVSGNINDVYSGFFKGDGIKLSDIKNMQNNQAVLLEAVIIDCGTGKYKNGANAGKVFGKFQVADQYNTTTFMTLWAEQYSKFKDIMESGKPIRVRCKVNDWNGNKSLVFQDLIAIGK